MTKARNGSHVAFIAQAVTYDGDVCLFWPFGSRNQRATTRIKLDDGRIVTRYVHTIVCETCYGPAPSSKHEVAHSCGKGHFGCIAPNHLRWATRVSNQADRLIHGTHNRGTRNGKCRLTPSKVQKIRASKKSYKNIAVDFGVDPSTISLIRSGRIWGWL